VTKKVLIVDDDVNALREAEGILREAGYDVVTLNNPKFVLKVIKNEKPDVVASDIIMPHLDGYALCEEVKKVYKNTIPVLLCTSQSYEQDLIQSAYKDFGADDYVLKPFNKGDLVSKVKKLFMKKNKKPE
jgi:DNA-binding response OmpR family regulator